LDRMPEALGVRRQTAEPPCGELKAWKGATHFLTRTLAKVRAQLGLHVLPYNLNRLSTILGAAPPLAAIMDRSPIFNPNARYQPAPRPSRRENPVLRFRPMKRFPTP